MGVGGAGGGACSIPSWCAPRRGEVHVDRQAFHAWCDLNGVTVCLFAVSDVCSVCVCVYEEKLSRVGSSLGIVWRVSEPSWVVCMCDCAIVCVCASVCGVGRGLGLWGSSGKGPDQSDGTPTPPPPQQQQQQNGGEGRCMYFRKGKQASTMYIEKK